jgi:hypothetical protein
MFVVHDFTYEPLNFRKNMFANHNFVKKRTSNFVIIHPKTLMSMSLYVWACKYLKKIVAAHTFFKKTSNFDATHPQTPNFYKKVFNFPQIDWTPKHNWWPLPTMGRSHGHPKMAEQQLFCKKPFHLGKIMTAVYGFLHINTYTFRKIF